MDEAGSLVGRLGLRNCETERKRLVAIVARLVDLRLSIDATRECSFDELLLVGHGTHSVSWDGLNEAIVLRGSYTRSPSIHWRLTDTNTLAHGRDKQGTSASLDVE